MKKNVTIRAEKYSPLCKLFMIMRLLMLLLLLSITQVYAGLVAVENHKITLKIENSTIEKALFRIEENTDYVFIYNKNIIDVNKLVNINVKDEKIDNVLSKLFVGQNVRFQKGGNDIIISPLYNTPQKQDAVKVTGRVTDTAGAPLPGVNVYEKENPTQGVITDVDGNYSITLSSPDAVLVFSFVGFESQELFTAARKVINVKMVEQSVALNEVVLVGYGAIKKEHLSGAVGTVKEETLLNRGGNNVIEGLQGSVPNLNINIDNGNPSSVPEINIRGFTSINGGSPLIVIDGVSSNSTELARLNPNDIESVSVLKDAASCAIYGARASYGVVLVKTKQGKGDINVTYNGSYGFRKPTVKREGVTDPYLAMYWRRISDYPYSYAYYSDEQLEYAKKVSAGDAPYWRLDPTDPTVWEYFADINYYDVVFKKNAKSQNHDVSISGENNKLSYYLSAAFSDREGVLNYNPDVFKKYNLRSRLGVDITKWLNIENNTSYYQDSYDAPSSLSQEDLYYEINRTKSTYAIYNPQGTYTKKGAYMVGSLKEGGRSKDVGDHFKTMFLFELSLIKDIWKINGNYTYKKDFYTYSNYRVPVSYKKGPDMPLSAHFSDTFADQRNSNDVYKGINIYTTFNKVFNNAHALTAVVGFNQESSEHNSLWASRNELLSASLPTLQLATTDKDNSANYTDWAVRGVFARLNYTFKDKYIVEFNGRYDGSSKYPKNNRFGTFPSVSLAWRLGQEGFMQSLSFVSTLKPRFSWGVLGNQSGSNYGYIPTMSTSSTLKIIGGEPLLYVTTPDIVSANRTWETVVTKNLGVDLGLFDSKLYINFDIYDRQTLDMLTKSKTLPHVLGASEPQVNGADLLVKGWDLAVTWNHSVMLASSPLRYSIGFNISDSRAWITKFDNPDAYIDDYYVGKEIGEVWGLTNEGLFQSIDEIKNHAYQTQWASNEVNYFAPGDVKWKDMNGDGYIDYGSKRYGDTGDFSVIGNTNTYYRYGVNISVEWKNIEIQMLGTGVGKHDWFPRNSGMIFSILNSPHPMIMQYYLDDMWTPENRDAYFPRLKAYAAEDPQYELGIPQTRYVFSAAYFRIKNLTIGYTLPTPVLNKLKVKKIRFYFSCENLFTISGLTKYFYDPEVLNKDGQYPLEKTTTFGVNFIL
jgi:TonB-linked SusC/RagA family outer membrane protein